MRSFDSPGRRDLAALAVDARRMDRRERQLVKDCQSCAESRQAQRKRCMEAERRRAEFELEPDRRNESLATELYPAA